MRDLRIVFMGTPEFAVATLKALVDNSYKVMGVITAPDRPAGRGQKLRESSVKQFAVANGLKVLQPTNLKEESLLEELSSLRANLQVVVAFRMLPKVVWQMPEYGTFNLHASLLPDYRGAAPINWAIINGEKQTGATTFFIDEKIDTGEIIIQEEIPIEPDDTAGSLHDKLMLLGAHLVIRTVQLIETNTVRRKKQDSGKDLKTAHKIHKDSCRIDWEKPANDIYNHIRGLSPYPAAWTILENGEESVPIKIYKAKIKTEKHQLPTGTLEYTKKEIYVAVKNGFIEVSELQLPGKRRMQVRDVLNGLNLEKNARMA